jgi:hypothetical protein
MKHLRWFVLIFLVLLSACTTATTPTTAIKPTQIEVTQGTPGYPAPVEPVMAPSPNGYPAPGTSVESSPAIQPTADPKMGKVTGALVLKGSPWTKADLYLAPVIKNAQGTQVAAQLDREDNPKTTTDTQGKFVFVNVPPGRYALMYYDNPQAFLLLDPKTRLGVSATIEANNTIDLGTLSYDQLPQ